MLVVCFAFFSSYYIYLKTYIIIYYIIIIIRRNGVLLQCVLELCMYAFDFLITFSGLYKITNDYRVGLKYVLLVVVQVAF